MPKSSAERCDVAPPRSARYMARMDFDRRGWAAGPVEPLPVARAYTLLAKEPSSRMDLALWAHKARTFFRTEIELHPPKAYPNGDAPDGDAAEVEVRLEKRNPSTRVWLITVPIASAPEALAAGEAGARAIGGAGMDVLVARARRAWQIAEAAPQGGDPSGPLVLAAILASVMLAPIVPPGGGTIFGVKGARERLGLS